MGLHRVTPNVLSPTFISCDVIFSRHIHIVRFRSEVYDDNDDSMDCFFLGKHAGTSYFSWENLLFPVVFFFFKNLKTESKDLLCVEGGASVATLHGRPPKKHPSHNEDDSQIPLAWSQIWTCTSYPRIGSINIH